MVRNQGKAQTWVLERIGKNAFVVGLLAPRGMMTNNELTAKRADDSTSMVMVVLYNPLIPVGDPMAARILLPRRTRRTTIMRVRRMLSESEIEM